MITLIPKPSTLNPNPLTLSPRERKAKMRVLGSADEAAPGARNGNSGVSGDLGLRHAGLGLRDEG